MKIHFRTSLKLFLLTVSACEIYVELIDAQFRHDLCDRRFDYVDGTVVQNDFRCLLNKTEFVISAVGDCRPSGRV